jgi:hypothetical protein
VCDLLLEAIRKRRDATQRAQEVQHRPLACQKISGISRENGKTVACLEPIAIASMGLHRDLRIAFIEDDGDQIDPTGNPRLSCDQTGPSAMRWRDQRDGCQIDPSVEVFANRQTDQHPQIFLQPGIDGLRSTLLRCTVHTLENS